LAVFFIVVNVGKSHFKAQYHLEVLCLFVSCSLYNNYTTGDEDDEAPDRFLGLLTRLSPYIPGTG